MNQDISQPPKISVVMSVYNGFPYLQEAVNSILVQTFGSFEFIIIDDCSTDNSWQVLTDFAKKDPRIVLLKNEMNIGLTKSLNNGLRIAKGEYIARQDADDISLANRFERQVAVLKYNSEIVLVSCNIELIDDEGKTTGLFERGCDSDLASWYLLFYNRLAGHSQVMFRKQAIVSEGAYSESFQYCQDYELWCRLAKIGKICILSEVLLKQRFHKGSISSQKKDVQEKYAISQVQKNIRFFLKEELSLEELQLLQGFWLGHWWSNCFPNSSEAPLINTQLIKILKEFAKNSGNTDEVLSGKLDACIGNQFLAWIKTLSLRRQFFGKVRVSVCALSWNPFYEVLLCWVKELRQSVFRKISIRLGR